MLIATKLDRDFEERCSIVMAMYGVRLVDDKNVIVLNVLGMNEALDGLAKAHSLYWYGHC